ncbi:phage portal protein [Enemella evansiae]|uniref:Phage portal protein n=1 Tax=Enemella evansiae TaxID=2016499 RepID=A0A255GPG0_9ACTN|nr:phage portal protein [Enemella evansiae]OYO16283.1 phage portal protein [Enemella evansiae]
MAGWITRTLSALRDAFDVSPALRAHTYATTAAIPDYNRRVWVDPTQSAATIPAVYRALDVLVGSVGQLTLKSTDHAGQRVNNQLVRRPSLTLSRAEWLGQIVLAMATDGNAFLHTRRAPNGEVLELEVWAPATVLPDLDARTGRETGYWRNGKRYPARDVLHLTKMRLPGQVRGLGPIQAAQATLRGALDMRDTMGAWFDTTGQPAGVLTSDQQLSSADALAYRRAWNNLDAEGEPITTEDNPSRVKVLGKGLRYEPILLKPSDALWLEAQSYTTLEVARLFGIPASLMLASPEGDSQTYANVEQEWIGFIRFTLMAYLRPVEEALSALLEIDVRFVVDALLRTDTKSRYEAHAVALSNGFLTVNEVRALEGLPPLDGGDQPRRPAIPASTQKATTS